VEIDELKGALRAKYNAFGEKAEPVLIWLGLILTIDSILNLGTGRFGDRQIWGQANLGTGRFGDRLI